MSSRSPHAQESASSPAGPQPRRKGSVKRAREQLEAGARPTRTTSPVPRPPQARQGSHQTQWPLPASGLIPRPINPNQHPRFLIPRGPPPARPPRPSEVPSQIPSPSVYSVRSGQGSEASYTNRPIRSFSHPKPHQQPTSRPPTNDGSCPSPTSTVDMTPRISIATDELFRHSNVSTTSSAPGVPPVPSTGPPPPPVDPRQRTAGILPLPQPRHPQGRNSAVSPIPETRELSKSRQTVGSLASSRAMPSSWASGPAESEILGAYLDVSDSDENDQHGENGDSATLVRNASVGKRGKPTMRTISKQNTTSVASVAEKPRSNPKEESNQENATALGTAGVGVAVSPEPNAPVSARKTSTSTMSNESCIDPEKPRFARLDDTAYNDALQKEIEALPKAAPAMSDKRPGARRPPRLDMTAVRDAEARGSLSSLSDLIRRATKLASNLDRGRTASRADLAADEDFKAALGKSRADVISLWSGIYANNTQDVTAAAPEIYLTCWPRFLIPAWRLQITADHGLSSSHAQTRPMASLCARTMTAQMPNLSRGSVVGCLESGSFYCASSCSSSSCLPFSSPSSLSPFRSRMPAVHNPAPRRSLARMEASVYRVVFNARACARMATQAPSVPFLGIVAA